MLTPSITRAGVLVAGLLSLTGCPTSFKGDAHYPGGPPACFATCQQDGMEMSGFVYSGEFASSCVCRPRQDPRAAAAGRPERDADDAGAAAAVGVALQARRAAAAQQRQQQSRPR